MYTEKEKCARFIVACVNEFAAVKRIDKRAAFRYLYNNNGIRFLMEHYDIEHTLSMGETIDDLTRICLKNGGAIR